jgi:hypothetical protein
MVARSDAQTPVTLAGTRGGWPKRLAGPENRPWRAFWREEEEESRHGEPSSEPSGRPGTPGIRPDRQALKLAEIRRQSRMSNAVMRRRDIHDGNGRRRGIVRRQRERITITAWESGASCTVTTWQRRTVTIWSVTNMQSAPNDHSQTIRARLFGRKRRWELGRRRQNATTPIRGNL